MIQSYYNNSPEGINPETKKFVANILKSISEASTSKPRVRLTSSHAATVAPSSNEHSFRLLYPSKGD